VFYVLDCCVAGSAILKGKDEEGRRFVLVAKGATQSNPLKHYFEHYIHLNPLKHYFYCFITQQRLAMETYAQ